MGDVAFSKSAPSALSTKPLLPTPTPSSAAPCRSSLPLSPSDALPCRSVLRPTAARRRHIPPRPDCCSEDILCARPHPCCRPDWLARYLGALDSPAIRARSPAPGLSHQLSSPHPPNPSAFAALCMHWPRTRSLPRCHSALPHHLPLQPGGPRCRRIPRRPDRRLAHQLQLSFSTTEPGLISGRTPQCSDVVALLRSPKPAQ